MSVHESPTSPLLSRNAMIAGGVVLFHVAALWALQSGLLRRAVEVVVPAEILVQMLEPPKVAPPPPAPVPPAPQPPKPVVQPRTPTPPPAPQPLAIADPTPAPAAPTGVIEPPPAPPIAAPVAPAPPAPAPAPPAPPAPTTVQLSPEDVTYIRPPRQIYPSMSLRLRETGSVLVSVYFDVHGVPKRAEVYKSSGFERLDKAAIDAVMQSRVTSLRRPGVNDASVFVFRAPINFVME